MRGALRGRSWGALVWRRVGVRVAGGGTEVWGRRGARVLPGRLPRRWVGLWLGGWAGGFSLLSLAPGPGGFGGCAVCGGFVLAGCVYGALARLGPPRAGRPCFGRLLTGVRVCVCVRVCSASPCCVAAVAFLTGVSSVLLGVCFLPCAVWDVSWPCFPCGVVLGSHYGQFRCASFLCNSPGQAWSLAGLSL